MQVADNQTNRTRCRTESKGCRQADQRARDAEEQKSVSNRQRKRETDIDREGKGEKGKSREGTTER